MLHHICIPNLFHKDHIPNKLPEDMQRVVNILKRSRSKEACIRKAYDILTRKYKGYRIQTYTKLPQAFDRDVNVLWRRRGFIHCHNFNYLMRILLIKSGKFTTRDIRIRLAMIWYVSIHQYLRIRINKRKFINVDLWGRNHGIKLGGYAHGFH